MLLLCLVALKFPEPNGGSASASVGALPFHFPMTDEERKAKNREKTRRYRARHRDDPEFRARVAESSRKWNAAHREDNARRNRERYHTDETHKIAVCAQADKWKQENPERWAAAQKAWRAANREKLKLYAQEYGKRKKLTPEDPIKREKRLARRRSHYRANREKLEQQRLRRHAARPELAAIIQSTRRAKKRAAMPKWVDRKALKEFYRAAKEITAETGVVHEVDHIVPLKHQLVCGLHVPANLQILTATENKSKNNSFVPN